MPRHSNQTSFKKGHKNNTLEVRKKISESLKAKRETGWTSLPKGFKMSQETIQKRAQTRRSNCLGKRYKATRNKKQYWIILTEMGQRYEHRVIMERLLGRSLQRSEHVHHKDGDGLNNKPENLVLLSNSEHQKEHAKALLGRWAKKHDHCLKCESVQRKHLAKGLCTKCYQQKE